MTRDATEQANAACAHALVEQLVAGLPPGVQRNVVVSPGSRSTPLVLAFAAAPRAQLHVVLDERAAAFVALGLAQVTGRAVAIVTTSGSAAAHALPAAMEAHHAGVPLLVLTADRPPEAQDIGAPQTTSQTLLYAEHARAHFALPAPVAQGGAARQVPARWAQATRQAVQLAEGPWPGPVHLNCPFREPLGISALPFSPAGQGKGQLALHGGCQVAPAPELIGWLSQAKRGLIVCGPQVPASRDGAAYAPALWALAARLGWPVIAEAAANLGAAPLPAGGAAKATHLVAAEALLGHPAAHQLPQPDAMLLLGLAPSGRALQRFCRQDAGQTRVAVHPPGLTVDPFLNVDHAVAAPVAPWLEAANLALSADPSFQVASSQAEFAASWQRAESAVRAATARLALPSAPWFEGTAAATLVRCLPASGTLVVGNSLAIRDIDGYAALAALPQPHRWHIAARRGVSGIEGALAHVLGVALAKSRGHVVALLGDLTFLHDLQSLRLLAQAQKQVLVVVFDNGGGEIFSQLPIAANAEVYQTFFQTPQQVDAAAAVTALGGHFVPVRDAAELTAALAPANLAAQGPGATVIWAQFPAAARGARRLATEALAQVAL